MMLDEYPPGPCLVVGDALGEPVAILALDWPTGLLEGLTAFTVSDSARIELVLPAHIRPASGDGAECPCGGDSRCAGCGGTGVYRGVEDAIVVYPLTPEGSERCVCYPTGKTLEAVGGFVPRCFKVALDHRNDFRGAMPVDFVLDALEVTSPSVKVRRM